MFTIYIFRNVFRYISDARTFRPIYCNKFATIFCSAFFVPGILKGVAEASRLNCLYIFRTGVKQDVPMRRSVVLRLCNSEAVHMYPIVLQLCSYARPDLPQ